MPDELKLPDDLTEFLRAGRKLEFDAMGSGIGPIVLHDLAGLTLGTFHLQTYASPFEEIDPHAGENGAYHVPAVSLVRESEWYGPDFLFSWLPEEAMYASGDEEHGHLLVFPGVTWTDIVREPLKYIEAQWRPEMNGDVYLKPWPRYPFVPYEE